MKKLSTILSITGVMLLGTIQTYAQDAAATEGGFSMQVLKRYFIEGGSFFMGIVLLALILKSRR